MNVGDYVRTKKDGIGRIISFSYQEDDECCFIELSNRRTGIKQFNIVKSSPNIIDLIEVGDYVNGEKVTKVVLDSIECNYIELDYSYNKHSIRNKDIKSILAKEQFSQMEYKVGD